jgi:hypothetical protein
MDAFVRKVAAMGLPGVILLAVMATTGLYGAAAITASLSILGGPVGMLGGIAMLGMMGLATEMLAKYGLDTLMVNIYRQRKKDGNSTQSLCQEVQKLPISDDLKRKLREELGCASAKTK